MAYVLFGAVVASCVQKDRPEEPFNPLLATVDMPEADPGAANKDSKPPETAGYNRFDPSITINYPSCRIGTGYGRAHDLAVVVIADPGRSILFAVLDATGTIFDGELPFPPNDYALGKREDGSVLLGFGGLAPNVESTLLSNAQHAEGPVRIYQDGEVIFRTDWAWQFDIASNGSSFFTLEPITQNAPRLTIHNMASGSKNRFDIVDQMQEINDAHQQNHYGRARYNKGGRTATYSHTEDEVMIIRPSFYHQYDRRHSPSTPSGQYFFYPATDRRYRFNVFGHSATLFASSRQGYFADGCDTGTAIEGEQFRENTFTISKKALRWDGVTDVGGRVIWSRNIDLDGFSGMNLSDDGAHLILRAANLHVLNAATGETVFAFPTAQNLGRANHGVSSHWKWDQSARRSKLDRDTPVGRAYHDAALARLADVLPPGATTDDIELGGLVTIRQGRLAMTHRIPQGIDGSDGYKRFLYLFDMNGIQLDDKPRARVALPSLGWSKVCMEGSTPERGLQVRDGKLTYLTERLSLNAD